MNNFTFLKSTLIIVIFASLLFSCGKNEEKQKVTVKQKQKTTKRTAEKIVSKQTKIKKIKKDKKQKEYNLSEFNKVEMKIDKYNSFIDDMSLSDSNMLKRIKNALENGNIKEIDTLFRLLINSQNYELALHLSTNALENTTVPSERATYIGMTLQSFLGAEKDGKNRQVADNAFQMMCDISDKLTEKEMLLAWDDVLYYYSTTCTVIFKNLDDVFGLLEIANKYIYPINNKKFEWQLENIYHEIGYQLAYAKNLKEYKISKKTIKLLREYAQNLDDNMVPGCLKNIKETPGIVLETGELKLKLLLLNGIERYEKN